MYINKQQCRIQGELIYCIINIIAVYTNLMAKLWFWFWDCQFPKILKPGFRNYKIWEREFPGKNFLWENPIPRKSRRNSVNREIASKSYSPEYLDTRIILFPGKFTFPENPVTSEISFPEKSCFQKIQGSRQFRFPGNPKSLHIL